MLERFRRPPRPSLPEEAPWRELEQIRDLLRAILSALTGAPVVVPPAVIVTPVLPAGPAPPAAAPPTVEQEPVTTRLDIISYKLDVTSYKLDVIASLIPILPSLGPITTRLDTISAKLDTLISLQRAAPPPGVAPAIDLTPVISKLDTILAILANKPNIITGQKNVITAGTPVQLDDLVIPDGCKVTIIAKTRNSGYIYLGTKATAGRSNKRFDGLSAGLAVSLKVKNLNAVWIDASVSGDGVAYIVEQ